MCYICATNAENTILRAHYAFLAHRSGVSIQQLASVANTEALADDDSVGAKHVCLVLLLLLLERTGVELTEDCV